MSDSDQNTVWIFHGEDARFASAVFTTEADALTWAARHRVSGIVTEYPVANGWAVGLIAELAIGAPALVG